MGKRGRDHRKRRRRPGVVRGSAAEPQVRACLEKGGTLKEASEVFRENTGASVSLDALSRYHREVRAEAEQVRQLGHLVAAMVREEDDYPGCHVTVLARKLFMFRAMEAVRQLPDDAFETVSADRLSLVISRLERSAALTDRNRVAANDMYAALRVHMVEELQEEFDGYPDLREQFQVIWKERNRRKAGKPPRRVEVVVREGAEDPPPHHPVGQGGVQGGPSLMQGGGAERTPGPAVADAARRGEGLASPDARKPEPQADSPLPPGSGEPSRASARDEGGEGSAPSIPPLPRGGAGGAVPCQGGDEEKTPGREACRGDACHRPPT